MLVIIAVVLILFWTLFALSSVSVSFHSTLLNLDVSAEEIVEAGEFKYGESVLFQSKKKYISNINDHAYENSKFAYIRVLNIETVFPNKYVVHVSEREELFSVEFNGQTLVLDRDFRVLDIISNEESRIENKPITLKGLEIEDSEVRVGDFLKVKQNYMKKFLSVFLKNNRTYSEIKGKFSEIQIASYCDETTNVQYDSLNFTTFENRKFILKNPEFAFAEKVALLYAVESSVFSQEVDNEGYILDKEGQKIYLTKNESGQYLPYTENSDSKDKVALSFSLLNKCAIVVDNLTLDENITRSEKDIYYCFQEI